MTSGERTFDFSLQSYADTLADYKDHGYAVTGFREYLDDPQEKHMIMRHDIDNSLEQALRMAKPGAHLLFSCACMRAATTCWLCRPWWVSGRWRTWATKLSCTLKVVSTSGLGEQTWNGLTGRRMLLKQLWTGRFMDFPPTSLPGPVGWRLRMRCWTAGQTRCPITRISRSS